MKVWVWFVFVACAALVMTSCGSTKKATAAKYSKDPVVAAKQHSVANAEAAAKKKPNDATAWQNLAQAYVALASPQSSAKGPGKVPKDRDKYMKKAVSALEHAVALKPSDVDLQSMLGSAYSATSDYKKAAALLEKVARTRKTNANAWYAWGLAASNSGNVKDTILAWQKFIALSPPNDPRVKTAGMSIKTLQDSLKPAPTAKG